MVSSAAFSAFSCDEFDNGRSFLRADYSIECDSIRHTAAKDLAWLGILLFPVGMTLLYAVLLLLARRAIYTETPTALSRALDFLVRDFETDYYWWDSWLGVANWVVGTVCPRANQDQARPVGPGLLLTSHTCQLAT